MAHQHPPPPPPPPVGHRGPIPVGGPGPGPGPGPQPQHQQGPPPGFPPTQLPIRQQSSRISDLTPLRTMDEASCFKKLTTYAVFTLRKVDNHDSRDKPTWARSEIQEERWAQEDILREIKRLSGEKGRTVAEKKRALAPNMSSQVTTLLDDLITRERDRNFEWTLAQLDRTESKKKGVRQTETMTVYFKRSPLKDLNAVILHQNIERNRHERLMQQNRPPPQQQQQQQQQQRPGPGGGGPPPPPGHHGHGPPPPPGHHGHGPPPPPPPPPGHQGNRPHPHGPDGPAPFIEIGGRSGRPRKGGRSPKKYHSETDSVDPYDSEYSVDSDDSYNTSISSRSRGGNRRRSHHKEPRVRSYSRRREHHKDYHVDHQAFSPERPGMPHRYSVPDVPRQIPAYDPLVAAAYQAGKLDADAERYNLERLERERDLLEQERLESFRISHPPRPFLVERPAIVERSVPLDRPLPISAGEPRAIVSYGRDEPPRRMGPVRSYTEGPRYRSNSYYVDSRSSREDDFLRRREREAEDYMDSRSRPVDVMQRRSSMMSDRRPSERIVYGNPFTTGRRYPPSDHSWH